MSKPLLTHKIGVFIVELIFCCTVGHGWRLTRSLENAFLMLLEIKKWKRFFFAANLTQVFLSNKRCTILRSHQNKCLPLTTAEAQNEVLIGNVIII